MKGKKSVTIDQMKPGISVWIDVDVAKLFSSTLSDIIHDDIELPNGIWNIKEVTQISETHKNALRAQGMPEQGIPAIEVTITNEHWHNPQRIDEFLIIFNRKSHAILAGAMLVEDVLYPYFETVDELIKLNKNRTECVACGQLLYVPFTNVNICKQCEEDLK